MEALLLIGGVVVAILLDVFRLDYRARMQRLDRIEEAFRRYDVEPIHAKLNDHADRIETVENIVNMGARS